MRLRVRVRVRVLSLSLGLILRHGARRLRWCERIPLLFIDVYIRKWLIPLVKFLQ